MTREKAIEILTTLQDGSGGTYEAIRMAIEALQADRPRGEWIDTEFLKLKECSSCHCRWGMYDVKDFDYCPNCGAKMDGERSEK